MNSIRKHMGMTQSELHAWADYWRRASFVWFLGLVMILVGASWTAPAHAVGNSATDFSVFVPPNNSYSSRKSLLIVTNVAPQTAAVEIVDDDADGDSDDSVSTTLSQGQSYVIRIADGQVNDDAGGKIDGDYFRISSDHPVVVQIATQSNWQHDWVPSEGKTSRGRSFFVYAPPTSGADNDINLYAYEDNTRVTITDVSASTLTTTGRTDVDLDAGAKALETTLHLGEDLMVRNNGLGLDILDPGRTYWVRSTKPVTAQYGHLGQVRGGNQARDGAGFVPSVNGTSSGSLYFFAIPHNPGFEHEKELRVACFDDGTTVSLYGANANSTEWSLISSELVDAGQHLDFVGRDIPSFKDAELYKLEVDPPYYKCTAFEGNWLETGNYGTSDFASAVSGSNGRNIAHHFVAYVGPPGQQNNVRHPVGEATNLTSTSGGYASHLYIYTHFDDTGVTVRDADTAGSVFEHSFVFQAGQYYDVVIDPSVYDGISSGGLRPYLTIDASKPVMVVNGNFNDNWMAYLHSQQEATPVASLGHTGNTLDCGESTTLSVSCLNDASVELQNTTLSLTLPTGISYGGGAQPEPTANGNTLEWALGTLTADESAAFDVPVNVACGQLGAPTAQLLSAIAECRGTDSAEAVYADVATTQIELEPSSATKISGWTVKDVPDYEGAPPAPRVLIEFNIEPGSQPSQVRLLRAQDDPDADANQVELGSWNVNQTEGDLFISWEDEYALHYESSRYYRVEITTDGETTVLGPLSVRTASGNTGGVDSGLESNGRLAWKIAQRRVTRAMFDSARFERPFRQLRQGLTIEDSELGVWIPEEGPGGSRATEASPADLPGITNATQVVAADYQLEAGGRVASMLVVETFGERYEHNKALCDRASGAEIEAVLMETFPDGQLLRRRTVHPQASWGEYSIEVRLYEAEDGSYDLHSAWLDEQYPAVGPGQRVLNVQVWSSKPGYDVSLLDLALEDFEIRWHNPSDPPTRVFSYATALGGTLSGVLTAGGDGSLLRVTRIAEDGNEVVDEHRLSDKELDLRLPPFLDATLELLEDDVVVDRVWVSDGAWTRLDDSLWEGDTRSEVSFACKKQRDESSRAQLELAGCASLEADVQEFAGVARHIATKSGGLDLSEFSAMSFHLESDRDLRVCRQTESGQSACTEVPAHSSAGRVSLPLSAFDGSACGALHDVNVVSFVAEGEGELALDVRHLAFEKGSRSGACAVDASEVNIEPAASERSSSGCALAPRAEARPSGFAALSLLAMVTALGARRRRRAS